MAVSESKSWDQTDGVKNKSAAKRMPEKMTIPNNTMLTTFSVKYLFFGIISVRRLFPTTVAGAQRNFIDNLFPVQTPVACQRAVNV